MTYLFGDSTPFPFPFDFLKTLEAFMKTGTQAVLLEQQARKIAEAASVAREERKSGLEALEQFHDVVLRSMDPSIVPPHRFTVDYAHQLSERAAGLVAEQRRAVQELDGGDATRVRADRDRTNEEVGKHMCAFFHAAQLPVLQTQLATKLVDGLPDASAALVYPGGIGASYTFAATRPAPWRAPLKLSDLVPHLELVVGIKKSWIGGHISREPLRLDDWVVGVAELDDSSAKIKVRRRPDQQDALVFRLRHTEGVLTADVAHPGDPNADQLPATAEPADLPHLDRLWSALRATFDELLEERPVVTHITVDSEDVISNSLGETLIERLVGVLAPTTLELARRSPNAHELSLKRESKDGRREEIYLKRANLLETLQPLPREGRAVFAPLGLDDWVPAMTQRPPPVA